MSPTVDLATFCCAKDVERLHEPDNLIRLTRSSKYPFRQVLIVYQQVPIPKWHELDGVVNKVAGFPLKQLELADPREVVLRYVKNAEEIAYADETYGWKHHHPWIGHSANHIFAAENSDAEYMAFFDADCYIKDTVDKSWIEEAIEVLEKYPEVLFVCPNWGQGRGESNRHVEEGNFHMTTSQQVIFMRRKDLLNLDWDAKWMPGMPKAPGAPDSWFYFVTEGRLWRHMRDHGKFRFSLKRHRWWHLAWH